MGTNYRGRGLSARSSMQARHGARRQRKLGYYIWSAERPVENHTEAIGVRREEESCGAGHIRGVDSVLFICPSSGSAASSRRAQH